MRPFLLSILVLLASQRLSLGDSTEVEEAEKLLKNAKIPTDDQSLLEFFRKQTLREEDLKRLTDTIPQLGDRDFATRERTSAALRLAGQAVLPFLKEALKDPDPEINRRAQELIVFLTEGQFTERACAVANLVQARKLNGACPILLDFLMQVQNDSLKEAIMAALAAAGVREDKLDATLVSGLASEEAAKRAACALLVGRFGKDGHRTLVEKLLIDEKLEIRLAAVQGLIAGKHKSATPALFALLTDAPVPIAQQADDLLRRIAGENAPSLVWDEKQRGMDRVAYEAWWKTNEAKLDLTNADVELDFLDVGTAVKRAVKQFYDLTLDKKSIPFKDVASVPYDFFGETVTSLNDLESKYGGPGLRNGPRYTAEIKKIFTLAAYSRTPAANKDALTKVGFRRARVVEVDLKDPNTIHKIMVFVSVAGDRPKVIGVRRFDEVK